jgi:molybdate/tungstate transport system substrate-binding protein
LALVLPLVSLAAPRAAAGGPGPGGPVDVLYAGSLTQVMENELGPAFDKATGYHFVGFTGGSKQLATEIKGRLRPADVFVSASPAVNLSLVGKAGGDWLAGYRVFATSALVIGYNPKSRFANALRSRPWYEVVGLPGFRLGRTDPAIDPKGVLAWQALNEAAAQHHEPALRREAEDSALVFPEESLIGRLQAGQVDAGFFYLVEAATARIPTVRLTGYKFHATYTVAEVNRAPHPAGAASFVAYLFSPTGKAVLRRAGLSTAQ